MKILAILTLIAFGMLIEYICNRVRRYLKQQRCNRFIQAVNKYSRENFKPELTEFKPAVERRK